MDPSATTTIEITQLNDNPPAPAPTNDDLQPMPAARINPKNTVWWMVLELVGNSSKIVAATIVLLLAVRDDEHTQAPRLFIWLIGHLLGSIAYIPLLVCRRFCFRNHHHPNAARLNQVVEALDIILYGLLSFWFMLGNVWVVADYTSAPTDAPKLYWISLLFLVISAIGYAMPLVVLCGVVFFVFPFIVFLRDLQQQVRGATRSSIRSLPTYTFEETEAGSGVVAAGTEHELLVNQEDAVCSICLENYQHNNELKHLPCHHIFHKDCVEQWLKLNASCPLCKAQAGKTVGVCCWICRSGPEWQNTH